MLSLSLGAWLGVAHAHHSFGTFDLTRSVTLNGTIVGMAFVNPHAWLRVNVQDADGTTTHYRCEMRGATVLRRSGWTPEMFVAGDAVRVEGAPDRVDTHACYVYTLVLANGRTLDRYSQEPVGIAAIPAEGREARGDTAPRGGVPNLAGDWAVEQQLMTDPRGRTGALVPASLALRMAPGSVPKDGISAFMVGVSGMFDLVWGVYRLAVGAASPQVIPWLDPPVTFTSLGRSSIPPYEQLPSMNCATTSIVYDWYIETLVNRISQTDDAVTIEYGQHGLVRTIRLNEATHPPGATPSRAGDSIGRWENEVLVVDTIGFLPGMLGNQTPHGGKLHVVERFSLNTDGSVLTREYEAEDPDYFVGPYRDADVTPRSSLPFVADTCDAAVNPFRR